VGRRAGLTREDARRAILDSASTEFAERGYEGARLARIATAAGLSPGAIYNHYRTKADLLMAVVHRSAGQSLLRLLEGREKEHPVSVIARSLGQVSGEAPLVAELILAARRDAEAAEVLKGQLSGAEQRIAEGVRSAQAAGQLDGQLDPDVVARFSVMVGLGAVLVGAAELTPSDQGEWTKLILRMASSLAPS
jgi:AcrR family transcriptional regulator